MNNAMTWAVVDENGLAINDRRFSSQTDAHASVQSPKRGDRLPNGKLILIGMNCWTAQVDESGRAVQS